MTAIPSSGSSYVPSCGRHLLHFGRFDRRRRPGHRSPPPLATIEVVQGGKPAEPRGKCTAQIGHTAARLEKGSGRQAHRLGLGPHSTADLVATAARTHTRVLGARESTPLGDGVASLPRRAGRDRAIVEVAEGPVQNSLRRPSHRGRPTRRGRNRNTLRRSSPIGAGYPSMRPA